MTPEETLKAIAADIREIKSQLDYLRRYEQSRVDAEAMLAELEYFRKKENNRGMWAR